MISQGTVLLAVLSLNANLRPYTPGKCSLSDGVYLMQELGLDMGYTGFNNYYGCGPHHKGLDSGVEGWVSEAIRYNTDICEIQITCQCREAITRFSDLVMVPDGLAITEQGWARRLSRVKFLIDQGLDADQVDRQTELYSRNEVELAKARLSEFGLI